MKIPRTAFQGEGTRGQRPEAGSVWPKQSEERMVGNVVGRNWVLSDPVDHTKAFSFPFLFACLCSCCSIVLCVLRVSNFNLQVMALKVFELENIIESLF